jgi:hypothetical protein
MTGGPQPWLCRACGAENTSWRPACWICFEPKGTTRQEAHPGLRPFTPPESPVATGVAAGLGLLFAAVGACLLYAVPGIGGTYFMLALPIFLLGGALGGWARGIAIVGIVMGVILGMAVAFLMLCFSLIGSGGNAAQTPGPIRWLLPALLLAAILFIGGGIWLVTQRRRSAGRNGGS